MQLLTQQSIDAARPWETLGPTWVEVDLDTLAANLTEIITYVHRPAPERATRYLLERGLRLPEAAPRVLVVVKADGYGHGAVEAARVALAAGADILGVTTVIEGLELRQAGIREPVLLFNPLTPSEARAVLWAGLTPTITDAEAAAALAAEAARSLGMSSEVATAGSEAGRRPGYPVHIAIDAGMSRFGVAPRAAGEFAAAVAAHPGLVVEGVYTHFSAGADRGASTVARMRQQLDRFALALADIEARGVRPVLRHAACSASIIELPEAYLDLVRVGNLFYGFTPRRGPAVGGGRPAPVVRGGRPAGSAAGTGLPAVREAWTLRTRVLEVREVAPGTGVGYGPDLVVRTQKRLATVPLGYADGVGVEIQTATARLRSRLIRWARAALYRLDRWGLLIGPLARLRRQAQAACLFSIGGRPVEILGRVSMQQTILDVTGHPEVAAGTPVEVQVKRVLANPRLGRVYYRDGQAVLARTPSGSAEAAAGWDFAAGSPTGLTAVGREA